MKVKVRSHSFEVVDLDEEYPIYRKLEVEEDHLIYWKFKSDNCNVRIEIDYCEFKLMTDESEDSIQTHPKGLLLGELPYEIITEKEFDLLVNKMIDEITQV